MSSRGKGFRPASLDELLEQRKKNQQKTNGSNNSLSTSKTGTAKRKPSTGVSSTPVIEKPRKPSRQEIQRKGLGLEPTEDESQMAIMDWAKLQRFKNRFIADYIHHSPNGGKRSMIEAKRFKQMGTKAGFPDLFLPIAIEPFNGLFIELKTSTGTVSATQRAYHPMLIEEGYRVEVCYSAVGAISLIKNYLGL